MVYKNSSLPKSRTYSTVASSNRNPAEASLTSACKCCYLKDRRPVGAERGRRCSVICMTSLPQQIVHGLNTELPKDTTVRAEPNMLCMAPRQTHASSQTACPTRPQPLAPLGHPRRRRNMTPFSRCRRSRAVLSAAQTCTSEMGRVCERLRRHLALAAHSSSSPPRVPHPPARSVDHSSAR